jgi:hypothetical protein
MAAKHWSTQGELRREQRVAADCHVVLDDPAVADEPKSWSELRVSLGALEIFDRLGFPDRDLVTWRLGTALSGYLETDFRDGLISAAEIEERVPDELLAHPEHFGIWRLRLGRWQ